MKALARQHMWWPGLDSDIESTARKCYSCQQKVHDPPAATLHPWEFPQRPWQRLHIDFAGPRYGFTWLIYVDAFSKYPGAVPLSTTTANSTCSALLEVFAHFGFPEQIVSDNGPPFNSEDFASFCRGQGIRHSRSSPYHPQSNGEAERFVQTFKDAMDASSASPATCKQLAATILLRYRVTPHTTTGSSPAQLLFNRIPRTQLDLLHPDFPTDVRSRQELDKSRFDTRAYERHFIAGDTVFSRNYNGRSAWKAAIVLRKTGPVSYDVQIGNSVEHRHASHCVRVSKALPTSQQKKKSMKRSTAITMTSRQLAAISRTFQCCKAEFQQFSPQYSNDSRCRFLLKQMTTAILIYVNRNARRLQIADHLLHWNRVHRKQQLLLRRLLPRNVYSAIEHHYVLGRSSRTSSPDSVPRGH